MAPHCSLVCSSGKLALELGTGRHLLLHSRLAHPLSQYLQSANHPARSCRLTAYSRRVRASWLHRRSSSTLLKYSEFSSAFNGGVISRCQRQFLSRNIPISGDRAPCVGVEAERFEDSASIAFIWALYCDSWTRSASTRTKIAWPAAISHDNRQVAINHISSRTMMTLMAHLNHLAGETRPG